MAVYKVPQDVEAEDKLLGPFSFRQFIFLMIVAAAVGVAMVLSKIALPLILIPAPIIVFFTVLALPLKKDQPMEVYLAAIISFMLKPKVRLWQPDGMDRLIEVIAPPPDEKEYSKGYSQEEVQTRLSYLANVVDSRGWSVRGGATTSSMQDELYLEAQSMQGSFEEGSVRSQQINMLLNKTNDEYRQQLVSLVSQPVPQPQPTPQYTAPTMALPQTPQPTATAYSAYPQYGSPTPAVSTGYTPMHIEQPADNTEDIKLVVNPYPSMNQAVLQPLGVTTPAAPATTDAVIDQLPQQRTEASLDATEKAPKPSEEMVSPAIIDLATNHEDLSVETLGREAARIKKKELKESEEIVISLR